jgi:Tfp pilus assembly protein PilN
MINLLPDNSKRNIKAARANVILLRYNLLTLALIGILSILCILFYVILHTEQSTALKTNQDNVAKAESFSEVRTKADEYRKNLETAKQILANGTDYTDLVFDITGLVPSGVVLDSISLNSTSIGQQTTFNAHAKTIAKATELKEKFQSSDLFSNVYLQDVTDSSSNGSSTVDPYPVIVTISAKLNETAAK